MATTEHPSITALLARAVGPLPETSGLRGEDLARMSVEAAEALESGDARTLQSGGTLRIHGAGVFANAAQLDLVGNLAQTWQRVVTAVGASLEGLKGARGRLPSSVTRATALYLTASPGIGSLTLNLEPGSDPMAEVAPDGAAPLFDRPRPLVDRASDDLMDALNAAAEAELADVEQLTQRFAQLGARATAAIRSLAITLAEGEFDLDASWREPEARTRRASWSAAQARWVASFIEGRELDAEEEVLEGVVITVSNQERWLIEAAEGHERVSVAELTDEAIRSVRPGDRARLRVRSTVRVRPGGETTTRREALAVEHVIPAD